MTTIACASPEIANRWAVSAQQFMDSLPPDKEGADRALAFRALAAAAPESPEARQLLCSVYSHVATRGMEPGSVYDACMFVCSLTECLDLLPLVADDVNRFLTISLMNDTQVGRLWRYVRDLHRLRNVPAGGH